MKTGLESLDTGASKITYSGNEGPKSPQQMAEFELQEYMEEFERVFPDMKKLRGTQEYMENLEDYFRGLASKQNEGIGNLAMADPLLIEEYKKYVFEMQEQGLQPMSFEEFVAQARAGMNEGGIANPRLVPHTGADLLVKKNPDGTRPKYQPPGGGATSLGSGRDYSPRSSRDNIGRPPGGGDPGMTYTAPPNTADRNPPVTYQNVHQTGAVTQTPGPKYEPPEGKDKDDDGIIKNIIDDRTKAAFNASLIIPGQTERIARYRKAYKEYLESMGITPPSSLDDEDLSKFYVDGAFTFEPGPARKAPGPFEYMQPDDVMNYGDFLLERFNNPTVKYRGDMGAYKREMGLGGDGPGITSQYPYPMSTVITPPGMEPIVTPPVETKNPFVPGSGLPFANYYVGANPNAAQLAYGQQMGVDPRMYGLTAYAADGGRIGYAGGGIADLRQGYFLGKLVKKIGRGIKKVVKSPIGKAALLAAPFAFKGRTGGIGKIITDALFGKVTGAPVPGERIGGLLGFAKKNPFASIAALSTLPLLFGQSQEEDEKNYYADASNIFDTIGSPNELRARALAGTLPRNEFPFQQYYAADGGRVGLMNGGDLRAAALNQLYGINDDEDKKLSKGGSAGLPPITAGIEGQASQSFSDDETPMPTQPDQMPKPMPNPMMMAGRMSPMMMAGRMSPMMMAGRMSPMMRGMNMNMPRMMAQEGGLMNQENMLMAGSDRYQRILEEVISEMEDMLGRELTNLEYDEAGKEAYERLYSSGAAQGGRIGAQEGGLMQMASAPDPMDALNDMSMNIFKKPLNELTEEEYEMLMEINADLVNKPMARPRTMAQEGGLMDLGGMEKDYRNEGGFVPIGGQERADDVPARLSKNEFVFTADAVRAAGGGNIDKGAEVMENMMENLEKGGKVSEESQGLKGARDMFATAQRLEGVL